MNYYLKNVSVSDISISKGGSTVMTVKAGAFIPLTGFVLELLRASNFSEYINTSSAGLQICNKVGTVTNTPAETICILTGCVKDQEDSREWDWVESYAMGNGNFDIPMFGDMFDVVELVVHGISGSQATQAWVVSNGALINAGDAYGMASDGFYHNGTTWISGASYAYYPAIYMPSIAAPANPIVLLAKLDIFPKSGKNRILSGVVKRLGITTGSDTNQYSCTFVWRNTAGTFDFLRMGNSTNNTSTAFVKYKKF